MRFYVVDQHLPPIISVGLFGADFKSMDNFSDSPIGARREMNFGMFGD